MSDARTFEHVSDWWGEECPPNIHEIIGECLGRVAAGRELPECLRRHLRHLDHAKRQAEIKRDLSLDYGEKEEVG